MQLIKYVFITLGRFFTPEKPRMPAIVGLKIISALAEGKRVHCMKDHKIIGEYFKDSDGRIKIRYYN